MSPRVLTALALTALSLPACYIDDPLGSGAVATGGAADAGAPDAEAPCALPDCAHPAPSLWRKPIEDYIAAASAELDPVTLNRAIDDLIVFDDRLYLGYGDATLNAGRVTPIEVRYFQSPDDEAPAAEDVVTTEEEIARFRRFDGALIIPGVDATEDAFLGNVFTKPSGGPFTRHRTVSGGVHVHDVAVFGGALYACGSGALDLATWNTGKVHSWLWRSDDGGETFTAAADVPNPTVGDRRFVELMPFADELLVFGYRTNAQGNITELLENVWDGATLTEGSFTAGHFLLGTQMFDAETAVGSGIYVLGEPLHFAAVRMRPGEEGQVIEALAGQSVLDIDVVEPGKALFLVADGDAYPRPDAPTTVRLLYTEDLTSFRELTQVSLPAWPTAVAHWQRGLYVGLANGEVWRSVPE